MMKKNVIAAVAATCLCNAWAMAQTQEMHYNANKGKAEVQCVVELPSADDAASKAIRKALLVHLDQTMTLGYRARIRNHGHSCFLCEIVIRSQFHTTYEPEA